MLKLFYRSYEANFKADPSDFTAASTILKLFYSFYEANLKASPSYLTAYSTMLKLHFSSYEANLKDIPFYFTAATFIPFERVHNFYCVNGAFTTTHKK